MTKEEKIDSMVQWIISASKELHLQPVEGLDVIMSASARIMVNVAELIYENPKEVIADFRDQLVEALNKYING